MALLAILTILTAILHLRCADHEYNELATLLLQPSESAIVQLYSRDTAGYFTVGTCAIFTSVYYVSTIFIYGISVPSGLRLMAAYGH